MMSPKVLGEARALAREPRRRDNGLANDARLAHPGGGGVTRGAMIPERASRGRTVPGILLAAPWFGEMSKTMREEVPRRKGPGT